MGYGRINACKAIVNGNPVSVNITGPTYLNNSQVGTFTANVSGGVQPYTFTWRKYRYCGGPLRAPCNMWFWIGSTQVIQTYDNFTFKLKVEVRDSRNILSVDEHYVEVGGGIRASKQGISDDSPLIAYPTTYVLDQNHPNPFNPATSIHFGLPDDEYVQLTIYSVLGAKVATLVNGPLTKGFHNMEWDGRNEKGRMLSSGIYTMKCVLVVEDW